MEEDEDEDEERWEGIVLQPKDLLHHGFKKIVMALHFDKEGEPPFAIEMEGSRRLRLNPGRWFVGLRRRKTFNSGQREKIIKPKRKTLRYRWISQYMLR